MKNDLIAAIEAGGTKFNCAIGTGPDDIRLSTRIETTTPMETMREVIAFFDHGARQVGKFNALGIGAFGPLDLNKNSDTYGYITTTPKEGWKYTDLLGSLRDVFHVPMAIDTDVNAAALGEYTWGNGRQCDPLIYITVGTGVGGGVLINGKPLHGAMHPEIGHLFIPAIMSDAPEPDGVCPFHGSCVEGLLSGPAIAARWGAPAENFPAEHECWGEFSTLMALALANLTLTLSPQRIILGGGVMHQTQLFPMIQEELQRVLNGYLQTYELMEGVRDYVVPPGLGDQAGILGAMAMAQQLL
ncbi:ROK family protein [Phragmitibacter flavus]|uniref:fructokinase n=1 Tax=Phragmitibacter flavus TaxID=2576071 RepID=A0A5R8KDF5_9BACT|nr:ROK family protein [Phragmitibacter flavus]TLD70323.1 ROK family protein [Phragmitibacter flavus]